MSLRSNAIENLDSDSTFATVLEFREERQFMREHEQGRKSGAHGANDQEDAVIALIDYRRSIQPQEDEPPSGTRRRRGT